MAPQKVVRKGEDAKAHKELNKLSGDNEGEKEVDTGKAQNALSQLSNAAEAEKLAKLEREKELAKVKIDKKDVELIMSGNAINVICCALQTHSFVQRWRLMNLERSEY